MILPSNMPHRMVTLVKPFGTRQLAHRSIISILSRSTPSATLAMTALRCATAAAENKESIN
jgi:hypothetical protein